MPGWRNGRRARLKICCPYRAWEFESPPGTKSKYIFDKWIRLGDVAKWLTQWFAKPPFMGSNPIVASKILELGKYNFETKLF